MIKLLFFVIVILTLMNFFWYFLYRRISRKLAVSEEKADRYFEYCKAVDRENTKLREEMKIKSKNERKANEKIDSLHSGDLSADDILPK